jgi:hypothetical protein
VSITFSEYEKNNPTQAGYFRIGHIVLSVPPTDIKSDKLVNNDRLTTLRGRNDMIKKTGQSRWDVSVAFKVMIDDTASTEDGRYKQWEDLRAILAMFHAAPFVEVENGFIRQALAEQDSSMTNSRMGFGLRQLSVKTNSDLIDVLDVDLTMTLFNYFPYSSDFGYIGDKGQSTDAYLCAPFQQYIASWQQKNLDGGPESSYDGSPLLNWRDQIDGTVKLRYRQYQTQKIGTMVATGVSAAATAAVASAVQNTVVPQIAANANSSSIAAAARAAAATASQKTGLPAELIFGQWAFETQGFTNRGARTLNNLGGVRWPGTKIYRPFATIADFGVYYGSLMTGKRYGTVIAATPKTAAGLAAALKSKGYYEGPEPDYAKGIALYAPQYSNPAAGGKKSKIPAVLVASPPTAAKPAALTPIADTTGSAPGDSLTAEQSAHVLKLIEEGWSYDHAVNDVAFFYQEQELTFSDTNHGDLEHNYDMVPTTFSILFTNNLAQIPLAGYQYPTYQHIGSTSAKFSLGFLSKGERASEDIEPSHPGIRAISGASEYLEAQYLKFRNTWRAVSSIHRMQAFYLENKVFNMLGLRGVMIDRISAQTLGNTSDTVMCEVTGSQYENIFEVSSPFKIRSLDSASVIQAAALVSSGALSSLTPDEANTITELSSFSAGRAAYSYPVLAGFLQKLGKVTAVDFTGLSATGSCDAKPAQVTTMLTPFATNGVAAGYPSMLKRLQPMLKSGTFTYGDAFLLQALVETNSNWGLDFGLTAADNTAQGLTNVPSRKAVIQSVYDAIFPLLSSYDANFATDINTLANSPRFSAQFTTAVSPQGPGLDSVNAGHGAYKDMGLDTLTVNGADFNPGYYFVNHNDEYMAHVRSSLDQVVTAATQTAAAVNTPVRPDSYDIAITESEYVGQNADTNSLVRMTNIPGYSMAEAFPTYKLFLLEDASPGWIQGFDNFYSYASVLDIEVMKYKDKPDLARITITNVANILQHKLFDNTSQGKYELELYKREFFSTTPASGAGPVSGGDPNAALVGGRTISGQAYQVQQLLGYDLRDGVVPGKVERVPLQYAVLQPGTKIQIRMGYSNNPDLLTPVFTGRVETVEGDDILTIEAESYLAELCELPTKDQKAVAGKKRGGWQPWHDSADVASVVESMLKMDNAKHFGSFKLAALSDPLITGLTWENRAGKMIGEFSSSSTNEVSRIGAAMVASYDRSGENILINHVINHLGDASKQRLTRDFYDESTTDLYYQFDYKIPDNSTKTIWEIIRDISRRYPEYQVLVKQYGFPFSADATLVVAHPLDWYFARLPMIGDAERYHASLTSDAQFTQWWNTQGATAWAAMFAAIKTDQGASLSWPVPTGPAQFYAALDSLNTEVQQFVGLAAFQSTPAFLNYADQLLGTFVNDIDSPSQNSRTRAARNEIIAVRQLWLKYLEMQNPSSDDRLKPVRMHHFIDHQSIIHNSMRVNDKIYNAVRVGAHTASANGNIPSHYTRILDVTDLLIDAEANIEPYDHLCKAIQQSFLKEELGKMYEGEIILRGTPEIEPGHALIMLDPSTAIVGIVEVDHVLHSFNQETGCTTTVYPRAITTVNEAATANISRMFCMVMGKSLGNLTGLGQAIVHSNTSTKIAAGVGGAAVATTAAVGAALIGGPPEWVLESLIGVAIMGGIIYTGYKSQTSNLVEIMPVSRWGRPWMGGLEGYQISDFWQNIQNSFQEFKADNIYPLIDDYRFFKGAPSNTLPVTSPVK